MNEKELEELEEKIMKFLMQKTGLSRAEIEKMVDDRINFLIELSRESKKHSEVIA